MRIDFQTENKVILDQVNEFLNTWKEQTVIESKTSGSTGVPKKISFQKEWMINSCKMTGELLDLKEGMTAFLCLSPETIAGKMMIARSLVLNLNLTVGDVSALPFSESNPQYDFVAMVPMQVQSCIENDIDLSEIRNLIIGGAPISTKLWDEIAKRELNAYQTFGMTETISHIALRKITTEKEDYQTLPGVQISVSDDQLVIDAPHLGVSNLKTNDCIKLLSPNSFEWIGRADFTINSGGVKIHPEIIEKQLSTFIQQPFFSFGLDDIQLGQRHILCIEGELAVKKEELANFLDRIQLPKEIYFFEKLHYTASNKINRLETIKDISNAKKQVL